MKKIIIGLIVCQAIILTLTSNLFAAQGYKTRFNPFTGKQDYIIDVSNIEAGSITATDTVTGLVVSFEGGTFDTYLTAGTPTSSEYYSLPPTDGTSGQVLHTNGAGAMSWDTDDGGAGAGDIGSVGDVASGAAFDGTQGTILTFNNAGGDKTLDYDGTDFLFNAPLSVDASDPADAGAIRLDNAENIAWEASPAGTDMTLGVDASEVLQYSGNINATAMTENGLAVLNNDEIDASSELAAIMDDETGSGALMFGTSPTITTGITLPDGAVTLTDETTGNYVASVATTAPLTGGAGGSEGAALTIAIPKGNSTVDGYINMTDWGTFNNKVATTRSITIAGTANEITSSAGAQDLSADRTWTISLPATIDLGGKSSFEIPNGASPTVDTAGEIAVDTTDDQFIYYGGAKRVIPYHFARSAFIANLTSSDTQTVSLGGFPYNCTISSVACQYQGTSAPATVANITLANSNGTLMTHGAVTCTNQTTASTWVSVTAVNTLAAGLNVFFNVTNTPTVAYNYTISYGYTIDAQ